MFHNKFLMLLYLTIFNIIYNLLKQPNFDFLDNVDPDLYFILMQLAIEVFENKAMFSSFPYYFYGINVP